MSVLKLTKNDIVRNDENKDKIKLKKSDIFYNPIMESVDTETTTSESSWDKYKEFGNSEEGSQGWQKYLADQEASKQKVEAEEDKKWWEYIGEWLGSGGAVDTSLPMGTTSQVIHSIRDTGLPDHTTPKDDWDDEQRNIFGYLYSTSPAKAYQYALYLNTEAKEKEALQQIQDSATSNGLAGAAHTLGAIVTAPLGLADFLNDLVMSSAGVPITGYDGQVSPFEYSQAVTGGISEHLNEKGGTLNENIPIIGGKGWGDVYGLGTSIAQSAISGYTLGGAGTLVSYFGQGAAAGVDDALSRGASEDQAILYGTVLGVAEGLAEQIGIDNLFKLGASPTVKVAIKNILKQAGAEGFEEGLTSIISNIADNAIMQDQSNFNAMVKAYMEQGMTEAKAKQKAWMDSIEGIAYDTLGGFVSGGVHAGAHTGIKTAIDNHNASNMYGDSVQDLLAEAVDIGGEAANVADKYLAKYEKKGKLSGANLNELVYTNEQELRTQDKAKIKATVEAKLTEYGETGDVSAVADVLVKQASGEKLTSKEMSLLNQSKAGHRVSGELNRKNLKSGGLANDWATEIGTERINADVYNRELYDLAREKVTKEDSSASKPEGLIESKFKVSESGNTTINGEEASIKEISSVKDGEITLRLESGETVSANDVEFSSSDEMLYATVVDMNLNAETANAFIRGFNATEGLTAEQYALGFREAYRYGSYGFPVQEMSRDGFSASLSESQKSLAYGLGKVNAKYEIDAKQKAVKDAKVTNKIEANSMSIEEAEKVAGLTDRQRTSIKGLKSLSKSLGVNVRFFESEVNADGKRVGANGWYDPKTGIIYIDLHAGLKGEGTILFTAAHELTHHIREWSPAKFKVFADFLLENYGKKGISVDALVRAQMEKAKRNGREISYDTAYEEVIADSCEAMLADGDAIAKIARLKAKDRSLWQKIKNFITELVTKIKEAYKGLNPDSVEGKLVGEMLDVAERLKALWTEALVDASDNYKSAEKTLAENGIVVNSNTDSASLLSVRDVLSDDQRKKVSSALATRFGVTQQEAMDWLKAETSMASLILNPKYSQYLDYTPDPNEVAIKQNSDYPQGTVDFSPICAKRREFTSVMNNILRLFPNHVFAATDLAKIRSIMQEEGMTIPCGICYVEDRRQLDTIVAQNFIDSLKLYREGSKTRPDGKPFNTNQLKGLSLIDGDSYTPSVYELVSLEGLNVLKEKNPNMAEAWVKFNNARGMQSVRLLANEAEYKRQILKYTKQTVKAKNDKGGLRVYSFSDAEMFHLIDIIQVITDSATVGLSLQGYTKVNEYARAVKDTGEKLNRSLIPKGELGYHIEDGNVILDYDTVEGIDIHHPDFFDNKDNPNVGNITIGVSDVQIRAAMVSDFVDQIIPFHTGQSEDVLGEKGISTWSNYKDFQTEKDIATGKVSDHQINIYTEVLQVLEKEGKPITKRTFVEKFLQVCKENGLTPRFSQFLNTNEKGEYVYTEGYHKMLVDFKTFAQTEVGEYLPQMPVKPIFDNEYITKILKDYVKSQKVKDAELTKSMPKVIERITNEIVKPGDRKFSDRDSLGNELSAEQQEFFKDSKVRDKKGNLMVLYHGTTANFNTFKKGDVGFHFGTKGAARGRVGFGKNVTLKEVYLNITNPIVFDEDLGSWDADFRLTRELYAKGILTQAEAESVLFTDDRQYKRTTEAANKKLASVLLEKGYDGIAYSNTFETKKATTSYIIFNSNQAKEITNKTPTSNPDIRYSFRDSGSGMAHDALSTYDEELTRFIEQRGDYIVDSFDKLKQIVNLAFDNPNLKATAYFGIINAETLEKIKNSIPNLPQASKDILFKKGKDYSIATTLDAIRHIVDDKNLSREDVIDYLDRLADTILDFDSVAFDVYVDAFKKKNSGLLFKKQFDDGTLMSFNLISNKKRSVVLQSLYMDSADYQKKKAAETLLMQNNLSHTPEARVGQPSVNSISENTNSVKREFSDTDTKYSIREEAPPKKTKEGYKVFVVKNGKLYPPMVANPNAEDTPVGVWLNADVGTRAPDSKTGRMQVKAGGKGTQGGSGSLAFRPGWHLGETPLATQFDRLNPETGVKELFPENFVWALCDIAADHDYQEEAMSYGYTKNGKFQHSLAGLPKLPTDGFYKYRTNPNPDTVPWLITGAMKVKKLLSDAEVNAILESKGLSPKRRVGGDKTLADLGLSEYEGKVFSDRDTDSVSNRSLLANALESVAQNDIEKTKLTQYKQKIALIESEQKKLAEIRAEIKELSFAKGARDTKAIKDLQFEANQIANRINTYDKQLLGLESTKALKGVLEREKALLRKRLEQKGKESLAAYREKATKTQRELLTRYQDARKNAVEGRNKTAMRHKIKNVVSDLNKLLLHPTKEQHVPIGLQKVVADALDAINMDTMNAEDRVKYYNDLISKSSDPDEIKMLTRKRDFFEYRDMNFKDRIMALKNAYAEFKESDDPLIRNAHNDAIADLISNTASAVGNTSLKDMSLAQLEAVYDMYKAVLATVRNANKMFKEGRQATVTENSEAVKVEVKEVGGHQDRVLKVTKFLKKAGWDMLKPITAMKVIGSKTLASLFDSVRAAEDTWAVDVSEAKDFYEAISNKYGYSKWDFKTRYDFKDSRGEDFSISLEQMLSLYAYSKRAQADEHLEFGGFIFDDSIEVTERKGKFGIPLKYEVNDANPHRLGVIQVMEIIDKLTPDQRAFVDEMQSYLSDVMGAKGNEVSLALYDIKLYKEKNYFPLKTARYFREFDPEKSGTPKIKNSGFSKKTVPQAGNPIVLSNFMDVWASHVNDMSMYHAFVLPLEDFMRVYNYSSTAGGYDSVQQYIKNAYGSQANQYIERLMDDLNGGARVDSSASPINKGISLFKKASVFASASVVIQQPSAIARALAYINPKYFATSAGSALNLKKHKAVWEEIKKYAPVAVIKEMGYFDTGMGRSTVEWIKGNKTIKDKMDDVLSKAPAKADELSWSYIWLAVKKEIQATTNLTPGSEEFFKKTSDRFTEVITNTQVYDSVLSRSGMMRSKDTGMKMATAFMAEPTTTVNMMVDGIIQGKRGNKKFTASTVGAISASIILNSILVALVYAARDDDEDETYIEKYVGSLTSELLDGFNPLTYIPFVKDGWSLAQGYDVERSDLTVVSDLIDTIDKLFNDNKSGWEKVADATGAVSSLFGIPLKNLIRDAKGMYNLTKTILSGTPTTGAGISESIGDAFTSSIPLWDRLHDSDSNTDKLYKAMLSGDQAHISRIKSGYASEQDFEAAMRQALRENDSRIQEAAMAVMSGKGSERVRIQKEIIAEGHFKQDYVIEATNAEIQYVRTKIKEANEFTRKGKDSEADKIYESLLERGYSEEFLAKLIK